MSREQRNHFPSSGLQIQEADATTREICQTSSSDVSFPAPGHQSSGVIRNWKLHTCILKYEYFSSFLHSSKLTTCFLSIENGKRSVSDKQCWKEVYKLGVSHRKRCYFQFKYSRDSQLFYNSMINKNKHYFVLLLTL